MCGLDTRPPVRSIERGYPRRSPELPSPRLRPGEMPPDPSALPGSRTRHVLLQLRRQPLPALGRATAQARGRPAPQRAAEAGERRREEGLRRLRRAGRGSRTPLARVTASALAPSGSWRSATDPSSLFRAAKEDRPRRSQRRARSRDRRRWFPARRALRESRLQSGAPLPPTARRQRSRDAPGSPVAPAPRRAVHLRG